MEKIAFFTEGGYDGKVARTHPNMRTDLAWICSLQAEHVPIHGNSNTQYDLGIFIIPKKYPDRFMDHMVEVSKRCKTTAVMQEGSNWIWQDWYINTQVKYLGVLRSVDYIFCHNERDRKYYNGLTGRDDAKVLRTLMIEDAIDLKSLTPTDERSGTMIGGNFVSWYGGFDSYMIATLFDNDVYAPSMGRKQDGEESMGGITYLPYMNWRNWITELSKRKYAVHLMRTHAAGTFALNCAYLGIPCIGWKGLDTQEICFPKLSFEIGDMEAASKMAKHLATNDQFYDHVVAVAKDRYQNEYSEKTFINRFGEF